MSAIWFKNYTLTDLNGFRDGGLAKNIGIELTQVTENTLVARMPVDERTQQPFGLLHGGASCVLSESLGSIAAWMCIDPDNFRAVGVDINATHLRAMRDGYVIGTCHPLKIGRRVHVWQTDITDETTGKAVCSSRLTVNIIEK